MSVFKNMRGVSILIFIFYLIEKGEETNKQPECGAEVSCEEDKLITFLANIEVLSPESIFTLAIDDLESICSKLQENLKIIERSFNDCKTKQPKSLYVTLIRGIQAFNNKICCADNNNFLKKFFLVHPCLFELRQDFEACNGPADWNEEPDEKKVCKTYKSILDCYYIKAAKVCGKVAAVAVTALIEEVVENVLGHSCKGINSFPVVKDMMPDKYLTMQTASTKEIIYPVPLLFVIELLGYLLTN